MIVNAIHQIERPTSGPLSAKALLYVGPRNRACFFAKLKLQPSGCVEFVGARCVGGYGRMRVFYEMHAAHRVAWVIARSPLRLGDNVLHSCDNRPCCNVEHLFLGTPKDNVDDMLKKGRDGIRGDKNYQRQRPNEIRRGVSVGSAVLSEALVREIREAYAAGGVTQEALGARYGIIQNHVSKIVHGRIWGHVK